MSLLAWAKDAAKKASPDEKIIAQAVKEFKRSVESGQSAWVTGSPTIFFPRVADENYEAECRRIIETNKTVPHNLQVIYDFFKQEGFEATLESVNHTIQVYKANGQSYDFKSSIRWVLTVTGW